MNPEEYKRLTSRKDFITESDISDKSDRTLLYGYTCERDTWHVYIKDGQIHTVKYPNNGDLQVRSVIFNSDYVPDKRLYPDCCDYEFCKLLMDKGISLPFTSPSRRSEEDHSNTVFYGEIL